MMALMVDSLLLADWCNNSTISVSDILVAEPTVSDFITMLGFRGGKRRSWIILRNVTITSTLGENLEFLINHLILIYMTWTFPMIDLLRTICIKTITNLPCDVFRVLMSTCLTDD